MVIVSKASKKTIESVYSSLKGVDIVFMSSSKQESDVCRRRLRGATRSTRRRRCLGLESEIVCVVLRNVSLRTVVL